MASTRRVEILDAEVGELESVALPAMASTKLSTFVGHWVVVLACDGRTVTVADPMDANRSRKGGIRELSLNEFAADYRGILIRIVE